MRSKAMKRVAASASIVLITIGNSWADSSNTLGRLRRRAEFQGNNDSSKQRQLMLTELEKQLAIEERHDDEPLERDVVGNDFFQDSPTRQPTPAPSSPVATPSPTNQNQGSPEPTVPPVSLPAPISAPIAFAPSAPFSFPVSFPVSSPVSPPPVASSAPTTNSDASAVPTSGTGTLSPTIASQPTVPGSLESSPFFPVATAITESATITTAGTPQNRALETLIQTNPELDPVADQFQILQKYSLNTLYYSTSGETWADGTGWTEASSFCEWVGVSCDVTSSIVAIDLSANDLIGTLPSEVRALAALGKLYFYCFLMDELSFFFFAQCYLILCLFSVNEQNRVAQFDSELY
jgi:hypothetical protein